MKLTSPSERALFLSTMGRRLNPPGASALGIRLEYTINPLGISLGTTSN